MIGRIRTRIRYFCGGGDCCGCCWQTDIVGRVLSRAWCNGGGGHQSRGTVGFVKEFFEIIRNVRDILFQ